MPYLGKKFLISMALLIQNYRIARVCMTKIRGIFIFSQKWFSKASTSWNMITYIVIKKGSFRGNEPCLAHIDKCLEVVKGCCPIWWGVKNQISFHFQDNISIVIPQKILISNSDLSFLARKSTKNHDKCIIA